MAVVEDVFALRPMKIQEPTHAEGSDLCDHILPGSLLQGAVVEIQFQGESVLVDLLL